jgi:enamine deaminase RidA (YjgF/YER057c/UK114 family)
MTRSVLYTDRLMQPIATFSHGMRIGHTILLGAVAGTDSQRALIGDVVEQARQMFGNAEIALGLLGGGLDDVVAAKTYVQDTRDIAAYARIFAEFFPGEQPVHAVVGSWGFPLVGAALEIDLTASIGSPAVAPHYSAAHGRVAAGVLADLAGQLAGENLDPDDVLALQVTLADWRDLAAFDAAYEATFAPPFPARTVVVAPLAHQTDRVLVEAVAIAGGGIPLGPKRHLSSAAMLAADELFIAGQLGRGNGAQAQAESAWAQIEAILADAGMTAEHVTRTSNVLTDWRLYHDFNAGYAAHVGQPYPPRTTAIAGLGDPGTMVQISAQAHRQALTATVLMTG